MHNFINNKYPNADIIHSEDKGMNQTYYFNRDENAKNNSKYVGKIFSADLIDTKDYLASIEITKNYVEKTNILNTPKIDSYGVFKGKAYMIYEYIEGSSLEFKDVYNQNTIEYYLSLFGTILANVHRQNNPVNGYGWYTMKNNNIKLKNNYNTSLKFILSQLNYCIDKIDDVPFITRNENKILDYINKFVNNNNNPVVCHSDVKYRNLIDSNGQYYLIDWEFVKSASPIYDLVKTERQLISRFSQNKFIDDNTYRKYRKILHLSYDKHFNIKFSQNKYLCYWIIEMIECLYNCTDWYADDQINEVRNYYIDNIKSCFRQLEN